MSNTQISSGDGLTNPYLSTVKAQAIEAANKASSIAGVETTDENVMTYNQAMTTIATLFAQTTPYTEEDYQDLIAAMKVLEELQGKGPPPEGPTAEMQYNIVIVLDTLKKVGITTSGTPQDPLGAMNTWANQERQVIPWGGKNPVALSDYMTTVANTGLETVSTQWLIETILVEDVFTYYRTELEALAGSSQVVTEIIQTLTILVNLSNEIKIETPEPFNFPPESSADLPPPGSEAYDELLKAMHAVNEDYDGEIKSYEDADLSWGEAFETAYEEDVANANLLMQQNPGMTFEEAMSQQHGASDILNEFFKSDDMTEADFAGIQKAILDYQFEVNPVVMGTPEELEALWTSVMDCRNDLENLINQLDPIPVPTPEGYIPQREQPNTLSYFLQQIVNDIDSVEGATDADKAANWLKLCVADADGGASTFMNHINQAINAATSLNTEQKQEMQKLLMLFQSFMSMLSSIMKTLNQVIVGTAQKIKG